MTLIQWQPSPNFGPRRGGVSPDLIVLHYTAMDSCETSVKRLCDPDFEVSAHYLIGRDGRVIQMVDEASRAWHAGVGRWGTVNDVNSRSIGIELDNDGASPFPEPQMSALEPLMAQIMARWSIRPERVIGHSDMAPRRKVDPGPHFDWSRLAGAGLSVWPDPAPTEAVADAAAFRRAARTFGYSDDLDDATLLRAVRLRFSGGTRGSLAPDDVAMMDDLARRFPVDRDSAAP